MSTEASDGVTTLTIADQQVTIRPIRHDDACLEEQFIEDLSEQTKRNRFLGGVKQLSEKEIQQLCDVDYHDSMAYIATVADGDNTREIGVARYAKNSITQSHELAITIADDFRNSTLGRNLVDTLVDYAREHGVKSIYSMDLNSNTDMRKLAKDLGMSVRLDPNDSHQVIYSLNVDAHPARVVL